MNYKEMESKFSLSPNLKWESGNGAQADKFAIEEDFESKESAEKFFLEEIVEEFEKFDNLNAAIDAAREREGADVLTYTLVEWSEDGIGRSVASEVIDSAFFVVEK